MIGIIAVLIGILLPALGKARAAALSVQCLSNLHQLGVASAQYAVETKGYLPYPVDTLSGENKTLTKQDDAANMVWFNVLDPYLQSRRVKSAGTGAAADRYYTPIKQCPIWLGFGNPSTVGPQDAIGGSRTYKMNTHLRHNNAFGLLDTSDTDKLSYRPAKLTEVPNPSNFVYLGDGVGVDLIGPTLNTDDGKAFDMQVNRPSYFSPALRHSKGANILFVDFHASHVQQKRITKTLRSPLNTVKVDTWESEYINAAGTPAIPSAYKTMQDQNLRRNPRSPLQWSVLGKLYAPSGT